MGYYNLPSVKLPPGPRTVLDEALYQIKSLESLEVLGKLLMNAATQPKEEKFRRIRLSNAKINASIVQVPGCMEVLRELGWEFDPLDAESLVIREGKFMTMAEVRKIEDSKDRIRRELRSSTSTAAAASGVPVRVQA